ncbi:hypothetical protein C9374_011783 [Naegleria lovaniensis]|uniref:UBA domain-containing protein n=1 Tax=Naegleria lovaniensis TaxID=51637 RepID=A0AA88GEV3_NAELO|nr:uncharacterized protein C9374_014748 [Naegleria lovaniensis]XP_044543072.1 uncharacterized protein C9374_011783 [Naegleria lovaniensis]KAG2370609.1 hypothetical protein C9374_014748 [Naegleria lovaniensis]KAG2373898.1 hypothetical protein C9374_011783 [Naegleria lovaniensis]
MDITVKETKSKWTHTFPAVDLSITVLEFRQLILDTHNHGASSEKWNLSDLTLLSGGKFLKNDSESLADAKIKNSLLIYLKASEGNNSSTNVNISSPTNLHHQTTSTTTSPTVVSSPHQQQPTSPNSGSKPSTLTTTTTSPVTSPSLPSSSSGGNPHHHAQISRLEKVRQAALEMAKRANGGDSQYEQYHFVLEDQNGKKVHLPEWEREALVMGMILQKKSEEYLKKKQFENAFDCLKVADESFRKLSPQLLSIVDNYATLLIDYVWCMYKLQDPSMLFDAIQRLQLAEKILKQAHGENLERLLNLQQGRFSQRALYAKLSLLKGIICTEIGDKENAKVYLQQSQNDYNKLRIDPTLVDQLVNMGFSTDEARKALRNCDGNVEMALSYILEKREIAKQKRMEEMERKQQRKKQLVYGKTKNGKLVDMKLLQALSKVFPHVDTEVVVEALIQSNNDELVSTQLLCNEQTLEDLSFQAEKRVHRRVVDYNLVHKLCMLGFPLENVAFALKKAASQSSPTTLEQIAVDLLVNGKAIPRIPSDDLNSLASFIIKKSTENTILAQPPTSTTSNDNNPNTNLESQDSMFDEGEDEDTNHDTIFDQPQGQEAGTTDDDQSEEEEPRTPLDNVFNETMEDIIDEEIVNTFYSKDDESNLLSDEIQALELYLSKLAQ